MFSLRKTSIPHFGALPAICERAAADCTPPGGDPGDPGWPFGSPAPFPQTSFSYLVHYSLSLSPPHYKPLLYRAPHAGPGVGGFKWPAATAADPERAFLTKHTGSRSIQKSYRSLTWRRKPCRATRNCFPGTEKRPQKPSPDVFGELLGLHGDPWDLPKSSEASIPRPCREKLRFPVTHRIHFPAPSPRP